MVCGIDTCLRGVNPLPALKSAVRQCEHGVLVRSGCPLALMPRQGGMPDCHPPHEHGPGPFVLVQRCDATRRAVGEAVLAGPLHEAADVADLCRWLTDGLFTDAPLPDHLRPVVVADGRHR